MFKNILREFVAELWTEGCIFKYLLSYFKNLKWSKFLIVAI